jgi:hypothetical protein
MGSLTGLVGVADCLLTKLHSSGGGLMRTRALALLLLAGAVTGLPAHTASAVPVLSDVTSESEVLWLAGTPDQAFAARVENAVLNEPRIAGTAAAVLNRLQQEAEHGTDLNLLGSPGGSAADEVELKRSRQAVDVAVSKASKRVHGPDVAQLTGATTFDLRGYSINNGRTWQVRTEIDGGFCAGDCEITDIIRTTWKITPQRYTDVFAFTSLYKPNAGHFKTIYADAWVYCGGDLCADASPGSGGAQDGTGSGSPGLTHSSQANRPTVDKVRMRATFTPNSTRYYDGVRTGTAECLGGSALYCLF